MTGAADLKTTEEQLCIEAGFLSVEGGVWGAKTQGVDDVWASSVIRA